LLHCPRKLKEVLKTLTKWDAARLGQDAITLLGLIQDVTHKHDKTKQGTMALVELFLEFATTFQETGQPFDAYSTLFCARVDMVNAHGGNARFHPKIGSNHLKALVAKECKAALSNFMADEQKAMTATARASACEEFLACFFVRVLDNNRYKGLKQALDNEHLMNKGAYPKTMVEALKLLKNYVVPGNKKQEAHNNKGEESGVAFTQGRTVGGQGIGPISSALGVGRKDIRLRTAPTTLTQRRNSRLPRQRLRLSKPKPRRPWLMLPWRRRMMMLTWSTMGNPRGRLFLT
jgi:hypothetical protein